MKAGHALASQKCRPSRLLVLDQLRQRSDKSCTRASTHSPVLIAQYSGGGAERITRAPQRPPSMNITRRVPHNRTSAGLKSP